MNKEEFEKAKQPEEIEKLLENLENDLIFQENDYQTTAYNFLVSYLENPSHYTNYESGLLLLLSIEVLTAAIKGRSK